MPLARAWWRGSAWALAATLVVPGVLAIAIATIALGGGLRSLGAVAQIVNGPDVPQAQLDTQGAARTTESHGARLPAVPRTATSQPTSIRAFRTPATPASPTTPNRANHRSTSAPTGGSAPVRPVTGTPPSGSAPSPSQPAQGSGPAPGNPQPGPNPDPVRGVGEAAAGTVNSAVPAPAGPAAADAVTTVLDLVDPPQTAKAAAPAVTAP